MEWNAPGEGSGVKLQRGSLFDVEAEEIKKAECSRWKEADNAGGAVIVADDAAAAGEGVVSIEEEGFLRPLEDRPASEGLYEEFGGQLIPVIDVGPAVRGSTAGTDEVAAADYDDLLVQQVGRACHEWGFFQVVNHGIPQPLIHRLRQASKDFFQLPSEVKRKVHKHEGGLGYFHAELTNGIRDWREVFDMSATGYLEIPDNSNFLINDNNIRIFHNQWPSDAMPHLREICEEYMLEARKLAFTLIKIIWKSLGLPSTQFEDYFLQSKTHRFRFNYYPACSDPSLVLGIGAHTDVGALTVLLQDEVGGLQVRRKDGEWINVRPDPTSPVINVADVMQVLTNDKYRSVEHRVVVNKNVDRYSFSFSFNPAHWVNICPIVELTNEENPPKYKAINWGKYTRRRIDVSLKKLESENTQVGFFCVD